MAWILCAVAIGALVVDGMSLGTMELFIEIILLAIVVVLAFVISYRGRKAAVTVATDQGEVERLLRDMPDPFLMYGTDFRVTFFNGAAEQFFRLRAEAVVGHVLSPRDIGTPGWQILTQAVFPSLAPRVMSQSKAGETPQVFDLSFADPELELRVVTFPILDAAHETRGFLKMIRDRTAEIAALRSKSEFLTVASHQFRGPATDISWALQSLSSDASLGETNKMIVDTALAASQGLIRRIEDLLSVARMEEGQSGYAFEDTDVMDFIGKVLADVLPAARKAGIKIYLDRPTEALPRVTIDPKQLSIAMVNLLENAIRYNIENGEVTVRVDPVAGRPFIKVSVKDTGIGIPPEALGKLFQKFFRAENAVKSQTEGSGLGLYIVKGIIAAHGGEVGAESELGRGTTIYFTLPTDPRLVPKHTAGPEGFLS